MSLYDLQQRTDLILKKYEKYDKPMDKRRESRSGDDPFENELADFEQAIDDALAASKAAAAEKNRAAAAARNADVRRAKQRLLSPEGVGALNRRLKRGKGVTPEIVEERQRRVKVLIERVYAIPDGLGGAGRLAAGGGAGGSGGGSGGGGGSRAPTPSGGAGAALSLPSPSGAQANPLHFKPTEETDRFDGEWHKARARQDLALDRIERGVAELAAVARGAQDELDRQNPVLDDVDAQLGRATAALRGNNRRLKGVLEQVRSSRSFCVDFVLVAVLLGIGAYLASVLDKKKKAGGGG